MTKKDGIPSSGIFFKRALRAIVERLTNIEEEYNNYIISSKAQNYGKDELFQLDATKTQKQQFFIGIGLSVDYFEIAHGPS